MTTDSLYGPRNIFAYTYTYVALRNSHICHSILRSRGESSEEKKKTARARADLEDVWVVELGEELDLLHEGLEHLLLRELGKQPLDCHLRALRRTVSRA